MLIYEKLYIYLVPQWNGQIFDCITYRHTKELAEI